MMHHRCSPSSHMGACSCGLFHNQTAGSFSMIFSHKSLDDAATAAGDVYSFPAAAASSVDCTLSLGTPSTRLSDDDDRRRRSYVPNFCWDLLHCQTPPPLQAAKTTRPPANVPTGGGDPLLARRCANCDTTSTPLWRNGPRGPKSLCNACGIRFKKEERRANACNGGGTAGSGLMEHQAYNSWVQSQKMQCFSPTTEFRFIEDNDADAGIPFLSWRLNVTDRPASLVHDFTR